MDDGPGPGVTRVESREKRRHSRLKVSSAATVLTETQPGGVSWICDISKGGIRLDSRHVPKRLSRLELELHLPWIDPITVGGRPVHWWDAGRGLGKIGVEFVGLRRSTQLALEHVLDAARRQGPGRQSTVLAITESLLTRCSLEKDFYLLETNGVIVDSIPQALRWFHDWEARIEAVLVDMNLQEIDAFELLRHLGEAFPQVRRIAVIDAQQENLWLPAAEVGLADRLLFDPWDHVDLGAALRS